MRWTLTAASSFGDCFVASAALPSSPPLPPLPSSEARTAVTTAVLGDPGLFRRFRDDLAPQRGEPGGVLRRGLSACNAPPNRNTIQNNNAGDVPKCPNAQTCARISDSSCEHVARRNTERCRARRLLPDRPAAASGGSSARSRRRPEPQENVARTSRSTFRWGCAQDSMLSGALPQSRANLGGWVVWQDRRRGGSRRRHRRALTLRRADDTIAWWLVSAWPMRPIAPCPADPSLFAWWTWAWCWTVRNKQASFKVSCGPIPIRRFGEFGALLWIGSVQDLRP